MMQALASAKLKGVGTIAFGELAVAVGEVVEREGFVFADLVPA